MLGANIKSKVMLGALLIAGISIAATNTAYAATCEEGDAVPCVAVSFGEIRDGSQSIRPGLTYENHTSFNLPVTITLQNTSSYTIKAYGSGSDLVSGENTIPSVNKDTAFSDLAAGGESEWGMRWHIGDTDENPTTNYKRVPTSADDEAALIEEGITVGASKHVRYLTLGFGVRVKKDQPAGTYENTVTVAVVASPKEARSIFDISKMQEMNSDICANTTTPARTATGTATAGDPHPGDTNYVPETVLRDSRDGKKYLVRKLADGNCWMASNLEFDFVPQSAKNTNDPSAQIGASTDADAFKANEALAADALKLTSKDTDLNTMAEWTPASSERVYGTAGKAYTTQNTTGVQWDTEATDGFRSYSSWYGAGSDAQGNPIGGTYSNKTGVNSYNISTSGELYQRFGNFYNWSAATLGSGTNVFGEGSEAADSICPKGWKLPSNSNAGSFYNLITTAYGINSGNNIPSVLDELNDFPLSYFRTGWYDAQDGTYTSRINTGYWRTNTAMAAIKDGNYVRCLAIFGTQLIVQDQDSRGFGSAVRCVAR